MKLDEKNKKKGKPQIFSGKVEIAISGIDTDNHRMTTGYRRSLRVGDTTVEEVFEVIYDAILSKAEGC